MPTYTGTSGNDNITGSSSADTISGLGGDDILQGQDGGDSLYGGDGNDTLFHHGALTDSYNDFLYGENGDDSLLIGAGDTANGGSGYDLLYVYYINTTVGITMNFSALWSGGSVSNYGGTISNIESVEVVYGGSGNDTLTIGGVAGATPELYGMQGADTLTGGAGDDYISSHGNWADPASDSDTLYGLGGNDLLNGGMGDYLDGGTGTDALALDLSMAPSAVSLDFAPLLAGSTATIFGGTLISFEHVAEVWATAYDDTVDTSADNYSTALHGGAGNDTLIGNAGANRLYGDTGIDTLIGGAGDDTYYVDDYFDVVTEGASAGNDIVYTTTSYILGANIERLTVSGTAVANCRGNTLDNIMTGNSAANDLRGQTGNDTLIGNDGADLLRGDGGRDVMTGGVGADSFFFAFSTDFSGTTNATADLITDFNHAQGDIIALSTIDAIAGGADDAFAFIGTAAFSNVAGQLRYENLGGNTTVYGDTNGDGTADFAIALTGTIALVSGDFYL